LLDDFSMAAAKFGYLSWFLPPVFENISPLLRSKWQKRTERNAITPRRKFSINERQVLNQYSTPTLSSDAAIFVATFRMLSVSSSCFCVSHVD
jgi:hypothetical protein